MKPSRFGASLVFAVGAAVVAPMAWLALAPPLAPDPSRGVVVLALVVAYAAILAESARQRLGVVVLAGSLAVGLFLLASSLPEIVLGAAVILAICRSGYLYEMRPMRALGVEALLLTSGLLLGRLLAGPGPLAGAAAVWGFFLVQSTYFLIGGRRARTPEDESGDAFDKARARLESILEEPVL